MNIWHIPVNHECHCEERQVAMRTGKFFYAVVHAGYAFRDSEGVPRRKDGRPYIWTTCPYCGNDLIVGD